MNVSDGGLRNMRYPLALSIVASALAACTMPDVPTATRSGAITTAIEAPNPPVIWLHYDYLVADDHTHEPLKASIDSVVAAFRRHGITLHIDPQHTAVPETADNKYMHLGFGRMTVDCGLGPATSSGMLDYKAQFFRPRGRQPWHYTIVVHHVAATPLTCLSGFADVPGYDFIMGTGNVIELPPDLFLPHWRLRREAGLLMHELGHNLCLHHGGACQDGQNFKPNYMSVMNYVYLNGIWYAPAQGSVEQDGIRFDYSANELPSLDETHLDERVGVQAGTRDIVSYVCLPPGQAEENMREGLGAASGPIDWNCDGVIESDVAHDIDVNFQPEHGSPCLGLPYPCFTVLRGHDDWTWIHRFIRTPEYLAGTLRRGRKVP